MGRPALINRQDIRNTKHLDLLDPIERAVVRYRWGVGTGEPLTQAETAAKMDTTRQTVRSIELNAVRKIEQAIADKTTKRVEAERGMARHVTELAEQVATLERELDSLRHAVGRLSGEVDSNRRAFDEFRPLVRLTRAGRKASRS